ncbi:MAG: tetratricopeptide repeat protein [Opitutus sp.]|nr:tetratricopeptide repeat protein [Opitutus sp.]
MVRLQGKFAEAATLHAQTLEIMQRVLGAEHPNTLTSMNNLASAYSSQGKHVEAVALLTQTLEFQKRVLGAEHPGTLASMIELGRVLLDQQKFSDAGSVLREALVIREKKLPDEWQTFNTRSLLGGALAGQKKFVEAEPLLVSGYEGMKQREAKMLATVKVRLKEALERLVRLYTDLSQPEKAAVWQQKLEQWIQVEAKNKAAGSLNPK